MDWIDEARKQREIKGNSKHGLIDPKNDSRCFRQEAIEELLDALNYNDLAMEKGEVSICQWVLTEKYIKFAIKFIQEKEQIRWFLNEIRNVMSIAQERVRHSS